MRVNIPLEIQWGEFRLRKVPIEITKIFKFDSAHNLEYYHGKCEALHGHTYTLEVTVKGMPGKDGMVIDFAELKKTVQSHVIDRLDHTYLNSTLKINPTSENVVLWIWQTLYPIMELKGVSLYSVNLWETPESRVGLTSKDFESEVKPAPPLGGDSHERYKNRC